jgi:hypothetical protein
MLHISLHFGGCAAHLRHTCAALLQAQFFLHKATGESRSPRVKVDLLVRWCRVLDDRLEFIGEGQEHWKRSGNPGVLWVMTVSADEFLRRFLLHVSPKGPGPHPSLRPLRQPKKGNCSRTLPRVTRYSGICESPRSNQPAAWSHLLRHRAGRRADHRATLVDRKQDLFLLTL